MIKDIKKGDVLTFKATDNKYKVLLCTSVYKDKSPHWFEFAGLTYDNIERPILERVIEESFFGVGNRKNGYFKYSDKELEKMWQLNPEIEPYILGSYGFMILVKDFKKFKDNFEIIANLNIVDNLDKNGNGGMNASDWDFLNKFFSQDFTEVLNYRGQKKFKLKSIIRD